MKLIIGGGAGYKNNFFRRYQDKKKPDKEEIYEGPGESIAEYVTRKASPATFAVLRREAPGADLAVPVVPASPTL
jgi:hypothetical protein